MFLLPGAVITWYVTKTTIPKAYAIEIKRYLFARQHPEDGGWGLHIEGESSVFGTAMNYVVLRLLGADEEDKRMVKARGHLHKLGGALNGPHWAKFWLSVLGVMEWEAVNPVPPELWYVSVYIMQEFGIESRQAPPRLDTYSSMALVDSYAPGVPANVIHLFETLFLSFNTSYTSASKRAVHSTTRYHQLCGAP